MKIEELTISGCFLVYLKTFSDARGKFVKTYHLDMFAEAGLLFEIKEEYFSVSNKGVVRGMHFQAPPNDHVKMVYCPKGAVFDAFIDLRKSSPTYLKYGTVELNDTSSCVLVLPRGIAHGFCALVDGSVMVYKTSTVYHPESDTGVLWDSCGIKWPGLCDSGLVSDRDKGFVKLSEFDSPFI